MKSLRAALCATFWAISLVSLCPAAQAAVTDFSGNWQSDAATAIRFIRIAPGAGNQLGLRIYGACQPGVCLWGAVTARPDALNMPADKVTRVSATLYYGYAARHLTLWLDKGAVRFSARYQFAPEAGADKKETGQLVPSLWPAPWAKGSWEARQDADAGWGGGPRGGSLPPAKEVCQHFDADKTVLTKTGQLWRATAGGVPLFTTGWPEAKARDALAELRHFQINQKCETGGLTYWQRDGALPRFQPRISRACITFSPTTAHITRLGRNWFVVDGDTEILNLHGSKENAYALTAMIRDRGIRHKCVFAWPNPILIWWLR